MRRPLRWGVGAGFGLAIFLRAAAFPAAPPPASPAEAPPPGSDTPTSGDPGFQPPEKAPITIPRGLPGAARDELRQQLNAHPRKPGAGQEILATEALFVVNSYLASIAPTIYGGAGLVLLPAGLSGMEPGPERACAFVLVESLALYDLFGVNDDKMSEGDIFRINLAAWHGILLVNALVHHGIEKRAADRKKIVIVPMRKGVAVRTAWRF